MATDVASGHLDDALTRKLLRRGHGCLDDALIRKLLRRGHGCLDAVDEVLVHVAEAAADTHLDRFLGCFSNASQAILSDAAAEGLRLWATPADGPGSSPLAEQVRRAAQRWNDTVEGLTHRQKAIETGPARPGAGGRVAGGQRRRQAGRPVRPGGVEGDSARARRPAWGVLDRGAGGVRAAAQLHPLDDSVTLEVALTWIDPDTQEYQYESTSVQRSSANALPEFAPGSTFYARGLEIGIDAVDLGVGESAIARPGSR